MQCLVLVGLTSTCYTCVGAAPIVVVANFSTDRFTIEVFWQVLCICLHCILLCMYLLRTYVCLFYILQPIQAPITNCTANIIKYNITVLDQYSPASVTVPANMSSVEISEFPNNGASIVANREYTITVSAMSDQGTSYTSDPVVISKFS